MRDFGKLWIPQSIVKRPFAINNRRIWYSLVKRIYWVPVSSLITSVKNEKVKLVRALADTQYRKSSKKMVCEGLRYSQKIIVGLFY